MNRMFRGLAIALVITLGPGLLLATQCELECASWLRVSETEIPADLPAHGDHHSHGLPASHDSHHPTPPNQQHCGDHAVFATLIPQVSAKLPVSFLTIFDSFIPVPDQFHPVRYGAQKTLARHNLLLSLAHTPPLPLRI